MLDPARMAAVFVTLLAVGMSARTSRNTLYWALPVLSVGVGVINILVEAYAFSVTDLRQTLIALLVDGSTATSLGLAAALIVNRAAHRPDASTAQPRRQVWRLVSIPFAYLAIYLSAGALAFPHVADFYADKPLPGLGELVALQLARGVIFAFSSWGVLGCQPRYAPLTIGATFSILGGIAPLMTANPLMPEAVRLVHAVEVGVSNFLFGAFLAWVLVPRRPG